MPAEQFNREAAKKGLALLFAQPPLLLQSAEHLFIPLLNLKRPESTFVAMRAAGCEPNILVACLAPTALQLRFPLATSTKVSALQ